MKILIIRFSSIGDIVLTTPVIRTLKTQLSEAEIHYVTKKEYAGLLQANPYLDKTFYLTNNLGKLILNLRKERYDMVIDLHNNLRSLIIKSALFTRSRSFKKLNFQKWLYTNFKINRLPNRHVVDRYMDTVADLGVKTDNLGLDYFIPGHYEFEVSWLPERFRKGYVAVVIGGKYNTKKLPTDRIIELCDRINKPIILLGGKEEIEIGREIENFFHQRDTNSDYEEGLKELGKKARVFNGCGKFNLNQSASVIRQSCCVFTHDTGLMHVAAAFKKEIYSIWGNTVPEFGMYPYRTKFTILENKNLGCRPCTKLGAKKCPKGHFKCMNNIVFDFYIPESSVALDN